MTHHRPGGQPRPFGPDELSGVSGVQPDELVAETRLARSLEGVAARGSVRPSADFTDRVMAAVAMEPAPAPVRVAGVALRHGAIGAFLLSLRDAWRVTVSPAFPMAMRAQAMAMVLLVAGFVAGGGAITAGALGLLDGDRSSPTPPVETPSPSTEATPEPTTVPSESPEPSDSVSPSPSTESAEPSGSPEPSESAEDGGAATDAPAETGDDQSGTISPTKTPASTQTPAATRTPAPTETPSDDNEHSDAPETPKPSQTPDHD
ncbi:MAG: hypothetical protein ACYC65_10300 [Candidatus Limnocylindrales bacterium]